jgi:competence protein ComEC
MTLIYLTLAWFLGLILARYTWFPLAVWLGLGLTAVVGLGLARKSSQGRLAAALVLLAALGGGRYTLAQPNIDAHHLAYYNDRGPTILRGAVSAEPSVRSTYTQLELAVEEIEQGGRTIPVHGKAVFDVPFYSDFAYGDVLQVEGRLETPPVLEDFSYREYLASRGVHSLLRRPQVTKLARPPKGSALLRAILRAKSALRRTIEAILPEPDAGLLSGILLGLGHTLPDDLSAAFRAVGLTHIIVISGFNIGVLSQAVLAVSQRVLLRWLALAANVVAILAYVLLVGPSPPVVRAATMGGLVILGQFAGRRSHALTSLAAAGLFMTLADPLLLWSVSFQLSFAATLALVVLEPLLTREVSAWLTAGVGPQRAAGGLRLLRDLLLATTAAQLVTLPIIAYHFQQVSLIALVANVLVLPVQPAMMILGLSAMVLGALWLPAGRAAGWLVWPFSRYSLLVIQGLARVPWAAMELPRLGQGWVWAGYGLLCLFLFLRQKGRLRAAILSAGHYLRLDRGLVLGLALATAWVWGSIPGLPDGRLHLYFLDVGQGDAILLRSPGGRWILVDGGPDPLLLASRLGQIMPFWQRRLDLVVATHTDQDHLAGLVAALERYRVARVMVSAAEGTSALEAFWREAVAAEGAEVILAQQGTCLDLGHAVRLEVLHPPPTPLPADKGDTNRNSLVLQIRYGHFQALLTADIDAPAEEHLLASGMPLGSTLLKVSHHGAGSATSARFLEAVRPQLAVISVGQNRFGHPSPQVLERLVAAGARMLRTDEQGTIVCSTDGRECWIRTLQTRR